MRFKEIVISELVYWQFYNYFPTTVELWLVLPFKVDYSKFLSKIRQINGISLVNDAGEFRVVLNKYKKTFFQFLKKQRIFKLKTSQLRLKYFLILAQRLGFVSLIGLSGSLAYGIAKESDDFDLFIITKENRLWLSRFLLNVFAFMLCLKRKRKVKLAKDKVCLNLFFDLKSLGIAKSKQTEFVAREIINLKVLYDENKTWFKFVQNNKWVFSYFPNFKTWFYSAWHKKYNENKKREQGMVFKLIFDYLNLILGKVQLLKIKLNKLNKERILKYQLWFHPDDFETKYISLRNRALRLSKDSY
ncbi:MAG: hypothetical protein KatS3mg091_317 [Patescibacteria group bacterium]|nr:MAG: hypothetical protein KatS3mg091_317 [Patescibacteria group bacterium]